MVLAVLVFLLGTGLVIGGYALVTKLPGMLEQRRLASRLREVSAPIEKQNDQSNPLVLRDAEGRLAAVDRMVGQTLAGAWLSKLIEQSGVRTSSGMIVVFSLVSAALVGMVLEMMFRGWYFGLAGAGLGLFLPVGFLKNRRTARMRRFEEQFPEALDLLARALKAGHAFQTALGMAADELPVPVAPEFKKTSDQQNYGLPLREALNQMAERMPLLDVRFFVTAVLIQRESGGNLSEILENLASVVRERFKILRQVRVHTAHGRFTAWVLLALPAFLAIALYWLNPEHMGVMFTERIGQTLLIIAIVMQSIGYLWIRKVIKIEV
jgi:tight adherence protein B